MNYVSRCIVTSWAVLSMTSTIAVTSGYDFSSIFRPPKLSVNPALKTFAESATGVRFDIRLDVTGSKNNRANDRSQMSIGGMTLELRNVDPSYVHPAMPGINGPHPQLSTGAKALDIVREGSFVSLQGTKHVSLLNGCWELVWKDGAAAGSLVCGFDLDEDVTRNDATLPKGRIYLSFPVWDKTSLILAQLEKKEQQARASVLLADKNAEIEKFKVETNPLVKALHYRNAVVAINKFHESGTIFYKAVPEPNEVFELNDSKLFVTAKGLMWTKDGSFRSGRHSLLGTVMLKVASEI